MSQQQWGASPNHGAWSARVCRRPLSGLVFLLTGGIILLTAGSALAAPPTPFTQCPAIGNSPSCGDLVQISDFGVQIFRDFSVGPYDGADDTLVGVQNNSSTVVNKVTLSGSGSTGQPIFNFDGDGMCDGFTGAPRGCPFGPTHYEGPGTSYQNISSDRATGDVVFTGGLAPGDSTYFGLEDDMRPTMLELIALVPASAGTEFPRLEST
jgi:hypothetical protein